MEWQSIVVSQHPTKDNHQIGVICLNAQKTHNALSSQMLDELEQCLDAFAQDPSIACVWLEGAGEKAFCAGGDIRSFYDKAQVEPDALAGFARDYFTREYALDYKIHTYPKPIMCWADGIVMGGGVGLMQGADFRLVSERSIWAMPEITIGLFPDVGGSWFLSRMPARLGLWVGLTGSRLEPADLLWTGLADDYIESHCRADLLQALQDKAWSGKKAPDCHQIDQILSDWGCHVGKPSALLSARQEITALMRGFSLPELADRLMDWQTDDESIATGIQQFFKGSAISHWLVWTQFHQAKRLSLSDVFAQELYLSVACCVQGDFIEGVRALLVDKDNQPKWQYADVASVPPDVIARFYLN